MARYNKTFDLSIEDMELIEGALMRQKSALSTRKLDAIAATTKAELEEIDEEMREIAELLGRLHNQKVFFRPNGVYVGG